MSSSLKSFSFPSYEIFLVPGFYRFHIKLFRQMSDRMSDRMTDNVVTNLRAFANDSCRCIRNFFIFWWDPNALSTIKWCISQCQQLCISEQTLRIGRLNLFYILMNHLICLIRPRLTLISRNRQRSRMLLYPKEPFWVLATHMRLRLLLFPLSLACFLSLRYLSMKILSKREFWVWK